MGILKLKTEGGQGGRRGHSNMSHWDYTEDVKIATRKLRRFESKVIINKEIEDLKSEFRNI